jgi:hypothetical protein
MIVRTHHDSHCAAVLGIKIWMAFLSPVRQNIVADRGVAIDGGMEMYRTLIYFNIQ